MLHPLNKFHYVSIIALAGIIMIASQNTFSYAQPLTPEPFFNSGSAQGFTYSFLYCYFNQYLLAARIYSNLVFARYFFIAFLLKISLTMIIIANIVFIMSRSIFQCKLFCLRDIFLNQL